MCKTGTGGKGKGDRARSELVITRPYADVDVFTRSKMISIRTISPHDLPRHPHDRSDDGAADGRSARHARLQRDRRRRRDDDSGDANGETRRARFLVGDEDSRRRWRRERRRERGRWR